MFGFQRLVGLISYLGVVLNGAAEYSRLDFGVSIARR